jgi:ABC-type nitrate/sulfonate/bicarbonate transport system substrate-binding protein
VTAALLLAACSPAAPAARAPAAPAPAPAGAAPSAPQPAVAPAPAQAAAPPARPAPRAVKLAYASSGTVFAPLWAAQEFGLLEQHGLQSDELILITGGPLLVQSLVAGELDAAYMASAPAIAAIMAGAPLKLYAGVGHGLAYHLFTKDGTGVTGRQDVKGKRVGISRLGAESHIVVRFWARAIGLQDDDLIYVGVGDAGQRIPALEAGAIDVALLDPPFAVKAGKLGYRQVADLTREPVPWQRDGLLMLEQQVQREPAVAQAIVQAVAEGAYLLRADPERARLVLGKYLQEDDEDALRGSYDAFVAGWNERARPEPSGIAAVQSFIDESAPGTAQEPLSRFLDSSILDKLEREGFFTRLEQQYPAARRP